MWSHLAVSGPEALIRAPGEEAQLRALVVSRQSAAVSAGVPGVHTWQLLVNMKMLKVLSHRRGRYGIVVVYKRRTAGCVLLVTCYYYVVPVTPPSPQPWQRGRHHAL